MNLSRIIPVLTVDNRRLVKTVRFRKPRYIGDPLNAIKIYNEKMIDEIALLDITASKENREPDYDFIYEMADECFSPLAYGGGIKTLEQARRIISSGVEKIILNSAVQHTPELVTEIANAFGNSSTVVSLDVRKRMFTGLRPHFRSGTTHNSETIFDFARRMEQLGAGELLLNHIDREGTFQGLDNDLIRQLVSHVNIPVIACGGAHSFDEVNQCITATGASAIAAGSIFVYRKNDLNSIMIGYPEPEGLVEWLG